MALFGKKNNNNDDNNDQPDFGPESFSPKKAKAFFAHAVTSHQSENYEYAMQMWLKGLQWDPSSMDGLHGFLKSAEVFSVSNKKGVSKETKSVVSAKGPIGKYSGALLDFGLKRMDTGTAIDRVRAGRAARLQPIADRSRSRVRPAGPASERRRRHDARRQRDAWRWPARCLGMLR